MDPSVIHVLMLICQIMDFIVRVTFLKILLLLLLLLLLCMMTL